MMPNPQVSFFAAANPDLYQQQLALQQQQILAQQMMQDSVKPIDPMRQAGGWTVPISPLEGLTHALKPMAAALMQRGINKQESDLAAKQMQSLAEMLRGGPAQSQNPMSPQSSNPSVMAGSGEQQAPLQSQAPQGGVDTRRLAQLYAANLMFGPAAGSFLAKEFEPTEFTKMLREAGTSPDQAQTAYRNKFFPPVNVRPEGTVWTPDQGPVFTAPGKGGQITWNNGQPSMNPIPGAAGVTSGQAAAQSGGAEFGKAPYQTSVVNTEGAPSLMTEQQKIEAATGQPMPVPFGMQQPLQVNPQQPLVPGTNMSNPPDSVVPPEDRAAFNAAIPNRNRITKTPGLRLQDQGQSAEQQAVGRHLGEYYSGVMGDAAKAAAGNRYLDNMELAAQDIKLGKLAPAQSWLTQWAQSLGLPISKTDRESVGSIQALTSMGIRLAGEATRQSDAQPSQLQYFKILESMPNEARTPEGFQRIVSYMRDVNNYKVAKLQSLEEWRRAHGGSSEGFESQWPKIAADLPFVWNRQRRADDLKGIVGSGQQQNDPLGIRGNNR